MNSDKINNEVKSQVIVDFNKQGITIHGNELTFQNGTKILLTDDQIAVMNEQGSIFNTK